MRQKKLAVAIVAMLVAIGCAGLPGQATTPQSVRDQAIEYRAIFNAALQQFNSHLLDLPKEQQDEWRNKAIPIASAAVLVLNSIDMVAAGNGTIAPSEVQQFLIVKNQLIDLTANMILSTKK